MTVPALTYDSLVHTLFGASAFHLLDAGGEVGLFALLHRRPDLDEEEIRHALTLGRRPAQVLLLGTTALGLTVRSGTTYRNAAIIDDMFPGLWEIVRDLIEFERTVVMPAADALVQSLREDTNVGLSRIAGEGEDLYHRMASDPELEALFYRCMRSWSRLSNPVLVEHADLSRSSRVLDVGGGDGVNAISLARAYPHCSFTVLDLPGAVSIARERIEAAGMSDRIRAHEADIFDGAYPGGHDCVLFANQLLIWSPEQNLKLLQKAYDCLPAGGRVLVFSAISDESRDGPLYAALDNVYFMTLPAAGSCIYDWEQYEIWLTEAGFQQVERSPGRTWTPHGVISAVKPPAR